MATANGLQMTLISVRAQIENFSDLSIGLLVSGYFAGFLIGCLGASHLVARVGHTRAFLALAGIFSAAILMHILVIHPAVWIVLRLVVGAALAGLYMIIESWLNDKARDDTRGQVLAAYRFIELSALTLGQLLLGLFSPEGFRLFCLVAIFISLSLVPLAISRAEGPAPITPIKFRLRMLLEISPVAVAGSLVIGLTGSILFGLGPVFVQSIGRDAASVGYFMSAIIVGGAIAQVPLGRLSDKIDRRYMLALVALMAAGAAVFLTVAVDWSSNVLLAAAALYGVFGLSQYAIVIAHANDRADPSTFVKISGSLMLMYSLGAIVGPAIGSTVMSLFGAEKLFLASAVIHLLLGLFCLSRVFVRDQVPAEEKEDFVAVPRSTPEVFELDPRGD
jgi:MFS family permease